MSRAETETVLHFLRSQIAEHRGVARLERGAMQLAITREHDGETEYWSIVISTKDVELKRGALPLEAEGPLVTLFCSDADLVRISRGESPKTLSAEGDRTLFEAITTCFRPSTNLVGVRIP